MNCISYITYTLKAKEKLSGNIIVVYGREYLMSFYLKVRLLEGKHLLVSDNF